MLRLKAITLGSIRHGGYRIGHDGEVPSGAKLWLGMPDLDNGLDVTGRRRDDLLDRDNLPRFLAAIGRNNWWGREGRCRLYARRGDDVLAMSEEQPFASPVRPLTGLKTPSLIGRGGAGPALRYTGTPPAYPDGRYLSVPPIDGCHYFAYAGRFETDDTKRGFNCITYVGSVFGVDVSSGAMSAYGTQLATHCGCTLSDCENKTLAEAKAFFRTHRRGTFFMWSAQHVVVVVDGTVHEFRERRGGYNAQPVEDWQHGSARWWVRRAVQQF